MYLRFCNFFGAYYMFSKTEHTIESSTQYFDFEHHWYWWIVDSEMWVNIDSSQSGSIQVWNYYVTQFFNL